MKANKIKGMDTVLESRLRKKKEIKQPNAFTIWTLTGSWIRRKTALKDIFGSTGGI